MDSIEFKCSSEREEEREINGLPSLQVIQNIDSRKNAAVVKAHSVLQVLRYVCFQHRRRNTDFIRAMNQLQTESEVKRELGLCDCG